MKPRLRIVLPLIVGVLSLPLILWDIHNARVIESMGMAWDMGAPIWPYQASDILLRLLNAPAYSIAMPIANLLRLAAPMHFVLVGPVILIWWWFLGLTLDRGMVRWHVLGMSGVVLTLLLWTVTAIHGLILMRLETGVFTLLRFLTPAAWLLLLTCLLLVRRKAGGRVS